MTTTPPKYDRFVANLKASDAKTFRDFRLLLAKRRQKWSDWFRGAMSRELSQKK